MPTTNNLLNQADSLLTQAMEILSDLADTREDTFSESDEAWQEGATGQAFEKMTDGIAESRDSLEEALSQVQELCE